MANSDQFYLDVVEDVEAVLAEFGKDFQVRDTTSYNPDTLSSGNAEPRWVTGLVADQSNEFGALAQSVAGAGSGNEWYMKKGLLLSPSASIQPSEEVHVDGEWHPLSKVTTIKPADIVVLYVLDLTR